MQHSADGFCSGLAPKHGESRDPLNEHGTLANTVKSWLFLRPPSTIPILVITVAVPRYNCAKRSFHPCCTSNSDVRPFGFIIDFYEGEQKAASLLLSTGSLSS